MRISKKRRQLRYYLIERICQRSWLNRALIDTFADIASTSK